LFLENNQSNINTMRTKFATLLLAIFFINAQSQTIFSENMGTPSGTISIAANTFQNSGTLTYSNGSQTGSADVRNTSVSNNTGASAGGNVFFTSSSGTHGFSIEGINASNYNSLTLKFGYRKEALASHATFAVEYWNGSAWLNLANTASTLFNEGAGVSTGWYASKVLSVPSDGQINGLKLRFIKTAGSIRVDDVVLSGTEIVPTVTNSVVSSTTSNSSTFSGNVSSTGGSSISATGTVFSRTSINASPILGGSGVTAIATPSPNSGTGTFSNSSGATLLPNVQYSYNAYATKSTGATGYGTVTTFYTLAVTPAAPTVSNPTAITVKVSIGSDTNSSSTTYAVLETSTGNYVQADGSLNAAPVFQTSTGWGTKTVVGLSQSTSYTFQTVAKNGSGFDTSFGPSASATTLAMPSITASGTPSALATVYGSASSSASFSFAGVNLVGDVLISAPSGFEISITSGGTSGYAVTQIVSPTLGTISSTTVYIRLAATTPFGTYSGNVVLISANDNLSVNVPTASSTVTKKILTVSGITILNKQFDGNTTAAISGSPLVTGIMAGDESTITFMGDNAVANFVDSSIGSAKSVVVSGYSISGASSGNYDLTQPLGLTADITSNAGSDFIMNNPSPTNENANINYTTYQGTVLSNTGSGVNGSVGVMGFYLRDGGEDHDADNLPTELTSLSFQVINPNLIKAARLFVGSSPRGNVVLVNGQSDITFTGLTNMIANDDDKLAINLRVTFNSGVTDNEQFIFVISDATATASGSAFAEPNGGGINSVSDDDINRIEVTGEIIHFVQQPPSPVVVNTVMTPEPTLVVRDQNGNLDLDLNDGVFVVSSAFSSTITYLPDSFIDGVYSFNNIVHILPGTNLHLTADSPYLPSVNSTNFTVGDVGAPIFSPIGPICEGSTIILPTTSLNGFSGSWSPAFNNIETTTYTFTPNTGQNATDALMTIIVNSNIIPLFSPVAPINVGNSLTPLPTTSNNGITGIWSPALDNTQTTTYTFNPDAGICATVTTLTINVYDSSFIVPAFTPVAPICVDTVLNELPTTSNNDIVGTWSPDLDSTVTTTYTFTPDTGQNAVSTVLTIVVTTLTEPTFAAVPAIAYGATMNPNILPATSINGFTGSWSPALNNTSTTTYVFTPNAGGCVSTKSLTIEVQQPPSTVVQPLEDTLIVNPDGTPGVIEAPICLTDTKGELSVSGAGTPVYRVPIALPPGIKDVAPQLALEYSGTSVQGSVGMGWNLNGISSIMRVSSRLDLDGVIDPVDFDQLDRYALDGQRLIAVSGSYGMAGTNYQTENYSNMKIEPAGSFGTIPGTSLYGPQSFVVTFPDGSQAFYGGTSDSRTINEWKINRWIDPQGNYIDYSYFTENYATRITKISWGRNINSPIVLDNTIEFTYKNRLRAEYSYLGVTEIATKKILSYITVKSDGQLFRAYTIGHESISGNYQRVKYILESAGDNSVSNPVYFEYNTTENDLNLLEQSGSVTGSQIDEVDSSGDFDGNGSVDFVANGKVYLNPIDNNNNWYGIEMTSADKYVPVSVLGNYKLNQFQSILAVNDNPGQNHYLLFSYNNATNQMVLKNSFLSAPYIFNYCSTGTGYTPCEFAAPDKFPSIVLEGDYNGDGITEMIHIRPIIKRMQPSSFPFYTYDVDNYKAYFLNLKDNVLSENAGLNQLGYNANFCADFNGDGRTDILSVDKLTKAYTVYQYNMQNNNLEVLFSGLFNESIMSGDKVKQVVLGDFNGDSKMDIMIPLQSTSSSWSLYTSRGSSFKLDQYSNFEYYQPFWEGSPSANRRKVRNYRAADLNKDGKSDFITTEWESWNVGGIGDRNSRGYFRYKQNIGSLNTKPAFAVNQVAEVYSTYKDQINCLVGDFKNPNANFQFTFIQNRTIWKGQYDKDFELEATLTKVREVKRKISTEISYKPLIPSSGLGTVNDIYHSGNVELYPYTEMISVPSMKVVDKITVFYDGTANFKSQLYKYYGLVVNSNGLGVLGFKKMAKSSWFNTANPAKIWSCTQSNPQLLGQKVYEWSFSGDNFLSFSNPPIISHSQTDLGITINTYTSSSLPNQVRIIVPNKTVKTDFLTELTDQTEYFYDNYWNLKRTLYTNDVGTKETVKIFYDNPNGVARLYALGRVKQINETVSSYGDTYTTEQKLDYFATQPNLVQQSQKKGHNTDYTTENYEYDLYGNITQKSVSAPNVTIRVTKDKYDDKGRFVIQKTDNEGFKTNFEYNKLGQVTKSISPSNIKTITNYNSWGLPTDITVAGASTSPKKTAFYYYRDENANLITTTTNLQTNAGSRVFINKLGQTFKTSAKGFADASWISKDFKYDFLGRKSQDSEPYFDSNPDTGTSAGTKWNYARYDYLSRPKETEFYNGRIQSIEYHGLTTTTTDGPKTIDVTYDANGYKRIVNDSGETLNFNYYASGLQKEIVYGNHTVTYNYDGWGRQTYMQDPSVSQTPYTNIYNNFGELLTATTPAGTTITTYSPTGRIEHRASLGQNTNIQSDFTYNAMGLILTQTGTANGKSFSYTNTYNSLLQLMAIKEVTPDNFTHSKSVTYDGQGRLLQEQTRSFMTNNSSVNNGDVAIEYGYNDYNGMLEQYKDVATGTVLWKLNSANEKLQVLTASLGNGMQITNGYDADYYIKTINHADATNVALNLEYEFVRERGILNWRKNNVAGVLSWNETFSYDEFERLTGWMDPTGSSSNDYASDGRITENNAIGTYNYGGASRYRRTTADLNASGEVLYLTRTPQIILYNMFKNPVSITEVSRGSVTFEYNLSSDRSKSSVIAEDGTTIIKNKLYSGVSEVEVIEKPNQSVQFITYLAGSPYNSAVALEKSYTIDGGSYTENSQEFLYLHRDYQGTILAISGDDGTIKERRIFDPWGNPKKKYIENTAVADADLGLVDFEFLTDRGYTGHEHFFSVGIIHMNARIYDPVLRSFLSCDSMISNPDNPQNYNRYAYALNNPLMYVDYDGNDPVTITIAAAIIIGAAIGGAVYVGMAFYTGSFSWGGLAKSIVIGAASGAASWGVGTIINSITMSACAATQSLTLTQIQLMLALPQAAMHGIAQGFIQGVSGGDSRQSFVAAAVSSIAAGGYSAALPNFSGKLIGEVLFGTFAGGATARLTGGNFWEGAITGLIVSWLNHGGHEIADDIVEDDIATKATKHLPGKPTPGNEAIQTIVNLPESDSYYTMAHSPEVGTELRYDSQGPPKGTEITDYAHTDMNTGNISIYRKSFSSWKTLFSKVVHEFSHRFDYVHHFYADWKNKYNSADAAHALSEAFAWDLEAYINGGNYNLHQGLQLNSIEYAGIFKTLTNQPNYQIIWRQ
jgi:RHS repeat-associated protein